MPARLFRAELRMTGFGRSWKKAAALCLALPLVGCLDSGISNSIPPQARPAQPAATAPVVSARSQELSRYYRSLQNDLLTRGLLRTDGGGPDTPYDAEDLAQHFETIAFFNEYDQGTTLGPKGNGTAGTLTRWRGPVRIGLDFGDSIPPEQRSSDIASVSAYATRLARVTNHPISYGEGRPNFHVIIAGEDDSAWLQRRLRRLIPGLTPAEQALYGNFPRSFYCFVVGLADPHNSDIYTRAVAVIRTENPDLLRQSCFHEEIAQGLGLPNDSSTVRPSIFNDDDEFALLTSHDELLLKMLYDPRLQPGVTAAAARPVARIIAKEYMGQSF
jgi:hypothetical protein